MDLTENEKKKEYLKGYEKAVRQMKRSEIEIQELRLNRICPSVINDGMPHAHNNTDLSDYAARLDKAERKYYKLRYKKIKKCMEISDRIEQMSDENEKDVLMYRYIKGMKWEDICVKMGLSWRQIHRIHAKALRSFELK